MYEAYKEAAVRSLYETGRGPQACLPTAVLQSNDPKYFWRVPVRFYGEVRVMSTGPMVAKERYMTGWDPRVAPVTGSIDRS